MNDLENTPSGGESAPVTPETEAALQSIMAEEKTIELPEVPSAEEAAAAEADTADTPAETSGEESVALTGVDLAVALCEAVGEAAGSDGFHGGVRPDNISVQGKSVVLGSKLVHNVGEFTPQELEYMAPELFWDGVRTQASDVYSIGLILYSLYNYGRLPFWPVSGAITPNARASALQKRMSEESIQPPVQAEPELADVILRALAFRTEARWANTEELKTALSGCTVGGSADIALAMTGLLKRDPEPSAPPVQVKKTPAVDENDTNDVVMPLRRPQKHHSLQWLWILLGAVVVIGAVILLLGGGKEEPAEIEVPATEAPTTPPLLLTPTPVVTVEPTATPTPSGERYVLVQEDCSWSEAVERCKAMGGSLAVPRNAEDFEIIRIICDRSDLTYVWLGASRQNDQSWATPDGEVLNWFDFWAEGEPSGYDAGDGQPENYLILWRQDDVWYANDSRENPLADYGFYSGKIGFLCQMW